MTKGRILVPATASNIGSGFDVFGFAIDLYNIITFETGVHKTEVISRGTYGDQLDALNFYNKVFNYFEQKTGKKVPLVQIIQTCEIPMERGLGSSAAPIVGALILANFLTGDCVKNRELIEMGVEIEGHADNVVPCFTGGFVVNFYHGKKFDFEVFFVQNENINFLIPDFPLATEEMRKLIPEAVKFDDAIFNVKMAAQFLAKLCNNKLGEAFTYTGDTLHQQYRIRASKKMETFVDSIIKRNPDFWFISGSGPTVCCQVNRTDGIPHLEKIICASVQNQGVQLEIFD